MVNDWPISRTTLNRVLSLIDETLNAIERSGVIEEDSVYKAARPLEGGHTVGEMITFLLYLSGIVSLNAGMMHLTGYIDYFDEEEVALRNTLMFGGTAGPKAAVLDREALGLQNPSEGALVALRMMVGYRYETPALVYWLTTSACDIMSLLRMRDDRMIEPYLLALAAFEEVVSDYTPNPHMMEDFVATAVSIQDEAITMENIRFTNGEHVADNYFIVLPGHRAEVGKDVHFREHLDRLVGVWQLPELDETRFPIDGESCPATLTW